jgi:hypothetical protein
MSELFDRMVVDADEAIVKALDNPTFALNAETPGHKAVLAALTLLTKPENISLEMCVAYEIASDGGSREAVLRWFDMHPNQLVRAQECLAAAITAALQDNTEEKKT